MALMNRLEEAKNPADDVDEADEEAKQEASKYCDNLLISWKLLVLCVLIER